MGAVQSPGRHVIIFGERGVGKTSLAGLIHEFWQEFAKDLGFIAPRVNCHPMDEFTSIWSNVAEEIDEQCSRSNITIGDSPVRDLVNRIRKGQATPNLVRRLFESWDILAIPIIDEFDRVQDDETIQAFADTIKNLADHNVQSTLVLVGVADTVDELIQDHSSIDRNLVQILLTRLRPSEISAFLSFSFAHLGMSVDASALDLMTRICQGLPYYAHLIGLASGRVALAAERMNVTVADLAGGTQAAIDSSAEVIQKSYYTATVSSRSSIYESIVLACALAKGDERGYFSPVDIREPLATVTGQHLPISRYLSYLGDFCDAAKGNILEKAGPPRKKRYRFSNPLMKPYVILRALQAKLLRPDQI